MTQLSTDVTGLKADVKGLGGILGRIEQGVLRSQEKSEEKEASSRPNLVALISILITIISILIGGAWTIAGALARSDERDIQRSRELEIIGDFRNRESDQNAREIQELRLDRMKDKSGGSATP